MSRPRAADPFRCRLAVERLEPRDVPASVLDPNLAVRTAVAGLVQPTGFAFLRDNDFFAIEKASGQVKHVVNGAVVGVPLDLAVNNNSERGLLGIALHPDFRRNGYVYLYWTESTTGQDSGVATSTPLLGNRVDRFVWNGSTLTMDRNIVKLRALQTEANNPNNPNARNGNHNGGVIRFGPDGKLYVMIGDNGRRSQMQNLPDGPGPNGNMLDDEFGGPDPDPAHLTGVILRLNDDGSTPHDNPFFRAGALRGGDEGAALQKVYAFGLRNGFGFAFDPKSGRLWDSQNSDDAFSEINQVNAGDNLGWVQVMGPVGRVAEFKAIETSTAIDPVTKGSYFGLQQLRYSPTNIADTPEEALARMTQIYEGGDRFAAGLTPQQEVPASAVSAAATATFRLLGNGNLRYEVRAVTTIAGVTDADLDLGARGQNGPVAAVLFGSNPAGVNFKAGEVIASGELNDSAVRDLAPFGGTVADLAARMREGRVYVNVHTLAAPAGAVRGQVWVQGQPVSQYHDPEFSWKYEIGPVGLGFMSGRGLGREYEGDMFVGESRTFLENGFLFRLDLTSNRRHVAPSDPRLADKVADNKNKFDITESETLLFGRDFGIVTDIQTGPNGNLYVVSNSLGTVFEIYRPGGRGGRGSARSEGGDDGSAAGAFLQPDVIRFEAGASAVTIGSDDGSRRSADDRVPTPTPAAPPRQATGGDTGAGDLRREYTAAAAGEIDFALDPILV